MNLEIHFCNSLSLKTCLVHNKHTENIGQKKMVGPGFQVLFLLFSVPCAVNHITLSHSFIQKAVIKELVWAWLCANITKTNRTISSLKQPSLVEEGSKLSRSGNKCPPPTAIKGFLMTVFPCPFLGPNSLPSKASHIQPTFIERLLLIDANAFKSPMAWGRVSRMRRQWESGITGQHEK